MCGAHGGSKATGRECCVCDVSSRPSGERLLLLLLLALGKLLPADTLPLSPTASTFHIFEKPPRDALLRCVLFVVSNTLLYCIP